MVLGAATYALCAVAFVVLTGLIASSWRGRFPGVLLGAGSLFTAAWAVVLAYGALQLRMPAAALLLETFRTAAWLLFLIVLLGYSQKGTRALRWSAIGVLSLTAVLTLTAVVPALISPGIQLFGRLTCALAGMILIEQLYRNVAAPEKSPIRYLCLGLGAIFVCDFYLYSDALLFRRISEDIWVARGLVDVLAVPLLTLATSHNPRWSVDIFVSRGVVFHSAALLGAAAYLLVMSAAGYYVRYIGGQWGAVLQIVFLFAALQLLVLILFSGTLRARLKVFLSKNFFSRKYDYREEWLRFTKQLSQGDVGRLAERSVQAIADLVHSPGGALWLVEDARILRLGAAWNVSVSQAEEPLQSDFCQFLLAREWVIDLEEYRTNPLAYPGVEVPSWVFTIPRAWVIVPLILDKHLLGFAILTRSMGNVDLNWEVRDILKTAARQAASFLGQMEASRALLTAQQFESFNRMSAFVVHDLKNVVAQLSLLLSNADRHKHKPEFQEDMLQTISHSLEKMKRLLFQLRGSSSEPAVPVELEALLQSVVSSKRGQSPVPTLQVHDGATVLAHMARLERVIGHLVQNAIEATPKTGSVRVDLARRDGHAVITIADTGSGMTEQFRRERLFRPFQSTKSFGMGIGTYETRQYIAELGGRMEVESNEGRGTTFRILLPTSLSVQSAPRYAREGST